MRVLSPPLFLATLVTASLAACGGDDPIDSPFGATTIFVVVNPPENAGNTADVPATFGTLQAGVRVDAEPGGAAVTDVTGLAILEDDLAAGDVDLVLDGGPAIAGHIDSDGDVYDVAVAYDGNAAQLYPGFPIHYAVGGEIIEIASDADATIALNTDNAIVFFEEGVHVGNLVIEGGNVILFGQGFPETSVLIDGSVEVRGGKVRLRGVTITGNLSVFGNEFGMSFSVVRGTAQLNGQGIAFLGNVFCGGANVPSSNAALFDNEGLPPLARPGAPVCP
jgi:hypothetical protein